MITCKDIIEDTFMPFLQHEIKIICSGKTIRHGKLLLACMRSHYVCFTITNNYNEPKSYEIPYPFDITIDHDNKKIVFDYQTNLKSSLEENRKNRKESNLKMNK